MVIAAFLKRPGTTDVLYGDRPNRALRYVWQPISDSCWPPRLINVGCCDVVNLWGATYSPGARVSVLSSVLLLPWDVPVFVCGFSEESLVDAAAVGRRRHRCCRRWAPTCCYCCGYRRAADRAPSSSSLLLLSAVVLVAAAVERQRYVPPPGLSGVMLLWKLCHSECLIRP